MSKVTLYIENSDINNTIVINSGCTYFTGEKEYINCVTQLKGSIFADGYFPRNDWRELTEDEKKRLIVYHPPQINYETVGIYNIPNDIYQKFANFRDTKFTSYLQIKELMDKPTYQKNIQLLKDFILAFAFDKNDFDLKTLRCVHHLNLETSTMNNKTNTLIGIHLDKWDKNCGWHQKKLARNRVCINLGKDSRYFIVLNRTLHQMYDMLSEETKANMNHKNITNSILQLFINEYPRYPLMKIEIKPGQMYMAPTENIFHDGSSINMKHMDISITALGHFTMRKLNNA